MADIANIWRYDLRKGNSDHPANGACLFDAGMWLVYGRIGDNPPCSCPIIRAYGVGLNDSMTDTERQMLKPFILRIVGNRDPDAEAARLHYIVLETARRVVPLALDRWPEHQAALRGLPNDASYDMIKSVCRDAGGVPHAADNATRAANCAGAAAYIAPNVSARNKVWQTAIGILDGALRIGNQASEFDEDEARRSVAAFAALAGTYPRILRHFTAPKFPISRVRSALAIYRNKLNHWSQPGPSG